MLQIGFPISGSMQPYHKRTPVFGARNIRRKKQIPRRLVVDFTFMSRTVEASLKKN
jgi:hypothetical protein